MNGGGQRGSPASPTLRPDAAEIRRLVEAALRFVVPAHVAPDSAPLFGSGHRWLSGFSAGDAQAAAEATAAILEPLPERGAADLDAFMATLFTQTASQSMNTNGGGYLGFIPGGGLFHAALADFIALSINRYTTLTQAAPGLAAIEAQAIRWLCDLVGLPGGAGGALTSGGSLATLTAVHAARIARLGEDPASLGRAVAYVSEQGHYCLEKAMHICGFPRSCLRKIPVDDQFRLRVDALQSAIREDAGAGRRPFLVVGTAGTTSTGAVDDLAAIEALAREFGLWFHVDAAYGGFFLLTARGSELMRGIERADSAALDPHKSMFLPYGTGALVVRDRCTLRAAFDFTGSYLPESADDSERLEDAYSVSPELTRELRGLRIWLPLKLLGAAVFRAELEQKMSDARWMARGLAAIPGVVIVAEPQLSVIAFKLASPKHGPRAGDAMNRDFLDAINARGRILLTPFRGRPKTDGGFCLRSAILSFRTTRSHLEAGLEDVRAAAAEVLGLR